MIAEIDGASRMDLQAVQSSSCHMLHAFLYRSCLEAQLLESCAVLCSGVLLLQICVVLCPGVVQVNISDVLCSGVLWSQ